MKAAFVQSEKRRVCTGVSEQSAPSNWRYGCSYFLMAVWEVITRNTSWGRANVTNLFLVVVW